MPQKKTPLTAIITRTKNREFLLERAVQSVISQTSKDYIHVILNDGGDSRKIESLLAKYPDERRKVIHNKSSVGITAALNQAIRAIESDYIAILDDDDMWHPERLERSNALIAERQSKAVVAPMEIVIEDVRSDTIAEVERMPHPESWTGEVSLYRQAHRNFLSNGAIHYARELFDTLGGYDETLPVAEDWDFGVRLLMETDVEQLRSDEALVYYHQRPSVKDGDIGNSVHAQVAEQERAIMIVRNKYLRNDLKAGALGIGYIMNDTEQSLNNIVRLEGHINRSTEPILDVARAIHQDIETHTSKPGIVRRAYRKVRKILE